MEDTVSKDIKRAKKVVEEIGTEFQNFISDDKGDERLSEIGAYIADMGKDDFRWDIKKVKIILEILKIKEHTTEEKILTYIKQENYGWQEDKYNFYNHCTSRSNHCRYNYGIHNVDVFSTVRKIFTDEKYGGIVSYLFGYSLCSLFCSRFAQDNIRLPYFLQIACERNSNVYRLIHEIVHICDVNAGLIEHCSATVSARYGCEYDHTTLFPTQSTEGLLEELLCNRDVPVVIEGFENENYYHVLLRKIANVSGKAKKLDIKVGLNTLPIFICPILKSQYRNVLSMDLSGLDIDEEYLELIQKNKQMLSSWTFELIENAKQHTFRKISIEQKMYSDSMNKKRYFSSLETHINQIRKDYQITDGLSISDITNIGFLSFFMQEYMRVFERSIQGSHDTIVHFSNTKYKKFWREIIIEITQAIMLIHRDYSPVSPATIYIETSPIESEKTKTVQKTGNRYAKKIVEYYQSYGVAIRILPETVFKDDRYVFSVRLLPGTDGRLLHRYADEVRRLLEVENLIIEKTTTSIKITVSEKSLMENSLSKMLESSEFGNSNMELPYAVGYDIMGEMVIADIAGFPHLLIGGTSGFGKSSAIHSLLASIVVKQPPEKVKLLLLDFGSSRMTMFEKAPHMLMPVIKSSEIEKGRQCVLWLQELMEERLEKKDALDDRKHDEELAKWPSIICVIDEFPTFVQQLNDGRGNKNSHKVIEDLLARARKVKIHLILAAQDATKGNIAIKNTNLAAGIAFKCTNWRDSKAILDDTVATELSGKGAMYFKCDQHEGLKRMQGAYMDPKEIMDLLEGLDFSNIKADRQYDAVEFGVFQKADYTKTATSAQGNDYNETLLEIVQRFLGKNKISIKNVMDEFNMGYNKAKRLMNELEERGIVTAQRKGCKLPRDIIPDKAQFFFNEHSNMDDAETALPQLSKIGNVQEQAEEVSDDRKVDEKRKNGFDDMPPGELHEV